MADETRVITQPDGGAFRVTLEGPDKDGCAQPIPHHGRLLHETGEKPLMHTICWEPEEPCTVAHEGQMLHVGDPERPVPLDMRHSTEKPVELQVHVGPVEHGLRVHTRSCEPMHHAVQLQTPLQVRFVNPWVAESDYRLTVQLGNSRMLDVRLVGRTRLTPLAPTGETGDAPAPKVDVLTDLLGQTNTASSTNRLKEGA